MLGSSVEWSQVPIASLQLSVTLRRNNDSSTIYCALAVCLPGPVRTLLLALPHSVLRPHHHPPLYGQENGGSGKCFPPKHLAQFAMMCLSLIALFISLPSWTETPGEASFSCSALPVPPKADFSRQ